MVEEWVECEMVWLRRGGSRGGQIGWPKACREAKLHASVRFWVGGFGDVGPCRKMSDEVSGTQLSPRPPRPLDRSRGGQIGRPKTFRQVQGWVDSEMSEDVGRGFLELSLPPDPRDP